MNEAAKKMATKSSSNLRPDSGYISKSPKRKDAAASKETSTKRKSNPDTTKKIKNLIENQKNKTSWKKLPKLATVGNVKSAKISARNGSVQNAASSKHLPISKQSS